MTRKELKEKKLKEEKEFIEKEDIYTKACFDINSEYFEKMINILENAKSRPLIKEVGYELHHKIPRSFFKKTKKIVIDKNNLYKLTYSEHFMVHYFAYKCATKLMKSSMSLAMIQMKRVCVKNTTEYDTELLSRIFESIKYELYTNKRMEGEQRTFKLFRNKIKLIYNDELELQKIQNIHDYSNQRTEVDIRCKSCGRTYHLKSGFALIQDNHTFKCDCKRGYRENVNILCFGINKETKKSEWVTYHLSYTPSMKLSGEFITMKSVQKMIQNLDRWWLKKSIVDIKPENYVWVLDESRRLNRTINHPERISDTVGEFSKLVWDSKDVSNNFIYNVTHSSVETLQKSLKLSVRDNLVPINALAKYRLDYSEEELTRDEWERKLGKSWYIISKNYTITRCSRTDTVLSELSRIDSNVVDIIFELIEFMNENSIPENMLDYLFMCVLNNGKDIRDFK